MWCSDQISQFVSGSIEKWKIKIKKKGKRGRPLFSVFRPRELKGGGRQREKGLFFTVKQFPC